MTKRLKQIAMIPKYGWRKKEKHI